MSRPHQAIAICTFALAIAAIAVGCGGDDTEDQATEPALQAGYDITGSWSGMLRQKGLEPFRVNATISSLENPAQNPVSYTGIDCKGNWTYLGREGAAFRFREVIDRGQGGECKGVGTVLLTPFADQGVDYTFKGGGVESAGVLKRQD